jgi:hypothetical protein
MAGRTADLVVVIDASTFVSAALKANSLPERALWRAVDPPNRLILSQAVEDEYREVVFRRGVGGRFAKVHLRGAAERKGGRSRLLRPADRQGGRETRGDRRLGIVHMDYGEAIEGLGRANEKFEFPVKWGVHLQSEHERYLTEKYAKKPVIVMNYPKAIKAFYMRPNDNGRADRPGDVSSGLACGSWIVTSPFPLKATLFGDLQRITGGLLTEMALVMPRTGRRADILVCMVPGRGDLSVRSRRRDHGRVFLEARQALLMELRIGNRTTLLAHSRLAEGAVCLQHSSVMVAMHDVLAGRRGIGVGGHGHDRRQASCCESQTGRKLKNHDNHLRVGAAANV